MSDIDIGRTGCLRSRHGSRDPSGRCVTVSANAAEPPLHGLRVIDMSTSYAGPTASMYLADLGADVVKIERPGTGDDARAWSPPAVDGASAWFASANRNKRSIALDLRAEGGRAVVGRLLGRCRRVHREPQPGQARLARPGPGDHAPAPSAADLLRHVRGRPDRPRLRAPRLRPRRPGPVRADVGHRREGGIPPARVHGAVRHRHRDGCRAGRRRRGGPPALDR